MDRHHDEDDFYQPPPPKKGGAGPMLIFGIVLGAGVLLVLVVVVCGGAFFLGRVAGPAEPQPVRQQKAVMNDDAPVTKPAPPKDRQPEGMKAKNGPPTGPDK